MAQPILSYDFTLKSEGTDRVSLLEFLKDNCRDWCFQLEEAPTTGYQHFQGRLKLKVKKRLLTLKKLFDDSDFSSIHLSPTSGANSKNDFYVMKEETRLEGPWSSQDPEPVKVPWDLEDLHQLYPWQEKLMEMSCLRELRKVNVVIDTKGGIGKTTFVRYMMVHGYAQLIPFCNDYKDILRMVMDMPKSPCYLVDMPRAISKEGLVPFFAAVESIKSGYAYDDRYRFKQETFDPPVIIMFTNKEPDYHLLTDDRWSLWKVDDLKALVKFEGLPSPSAVSAEDVPLV